MPDVAKSFEYENNFYLTCNVTRIGKILAQYELYKMTINLPGAVVECGVFKGASFSLFSTFRELLEHSCSKKMIGFDTFSRFPDSDFPADRKFREIFTGVAGDQSISRVQMLETLRYKGLDRNIELVEGDITETVPVYVQKHPELKISLLNLDTDLYQPAVTILEYLYPHIVTGGILILDDYGVVPGETRAVDAFFKGTDIIIKKFPFRASPCYVIKVDQ